MRGITVVLCGSPSVRARMRRHIEAVSPEARIAGEGPSAEAARHLTKRFAPQLVIVAAEPEDGDYPKLVDDIQSATPQHAYVVLMPHDPIDEVPGTAAVLPRSRYSNRALVASLRRLVKRI